MYGPAFPIFRSLLRKVGAKPRLDLVARLEKLSEELTASVQPAVIQVSLLPLRRLATPNDWLEGGQHLELLAMKVAVLPNAGLEPKSLSVELSLLDSGVEFVDHFPATEFTDLGTREVQLTEEGTFVASAATSSKAGAGLTAPGAKLSAELSESSSLRIGAGRTESDKLVYTPRVRKVISSAVGNEAHWEFLATPPDTPIGGFDFFASILVGGPPRRIEVSIEIGARFQDWGDLHLADKRTVRVGRLPRTD